MESTGMVTPLLQS